MDEIIITMHLEGGPNAGTQASYQYNPIEDKFNSIGSRGNAQIPEGATEIMMLADGKGGYSALQGSEHLGTLKSDLGGRDALVAHLNTLESNVNDFGEQLKSEDKSLNNIDTKLDSISHSLSSSWKIPMVQQ